MDGRRFHFLLHTLFCLNFSSRWMTNYVLACVRSCIFALIAVLCGWQTFPFYVAHTLLFEFLSSVHHKLYSTERRYSLCKTRIMLAFSTSVRAFPQNAQVWFTWLICVSKELDDVCHQGVFALQSVYCLDGRRLHILQHTLVCLPCSFRCGSNYTAQSAGTASVAKICC